MDLTGWYVVAMYPRKNGKSRLVMEQLKNGRVDVTADKIDNVYICGYKARDLLVLATMLREEEIFPSDLDEYVRNIEHVYTKLEQDFNERILKLTKTYEKRGEF